MKPRILIAEREPNCLFSLKEKIPPMGYQVIGSAKSASEAIEQARSKRPDLVILNLHLEGEADGLDAARHIASRLAIPLILIGADASEDLLRRVAHLRPAAYLNKPIRFSDLRSALKLALYGRSHDTVKDGNRGEYSPQVQSSSLPASWETLQEQPSILEACLCEAFHKLTIGFILINQEFKVSFANHFSLRILEHSKHLSLENKKLRFTRKETAERIGVFLKQHERGRLEITGKHHALDLMILPLNSTWLQKDSSSRFALYLFDLTESARQMSSKLQTFYHFSETEKQVLHTLLESPDLKQVKQQLFVSESTVRTHMKNILNKSSHHKQLTFLHHILTELAWYLLEAPPRTHKENSFKNN